MVKLWEKSLIAKIALKRGVQLTTSERMAEDLKVSVDSCFKCYNLCSVRKVLESSY